MSSCPLPAAPGAPARGGHRHNFWGYRAYGAVCPVSAFANLGEESMNNFLDQSFLRDGRTTIREYIAKGGHEMPPKAE